VAAVAAPLVVAVAVGTADAAAAVAAVAAPLVVAVAVEAAAPDAAVAMAAPAALAAFSPFPVLFGALERSQARYRVVWRALIQAPQTTRLRRPTAVLLFWTSLPIFMM
jgi:hypothetical protein